MDVQAPYLRCPSRPQVRCQQTRPQTHSHWHKTMLLALGDKIRSKPRHSPPPGIGTRLASYFQYFQPQADHAPNTDSMHKDICGTSPLHCQEGMLECAGSYTDTCTNNSQIQTHILSNPVSQAEARRSPLHKQRYFQTSVSHHRTNHLLIHAVGHGSPRHRPQNFTCTVAWVSGITSSYPERHTGAQTYFSGS